MKSLYYITIQSFILLVKIASIFNHKARLFVNGRKKIFEELREFSEGQKVAWFHCASLGEFEQGRALIEKLKKKYPDYRILLTFFSPSGYEIRKNYKFADHVTYLPIDTPENARKFINLVKPDKVFFIKYEFWYFFLRELKKFRVDTYLVSGIFRKDQYFFKWYGKGFRKMIDWFDYIFVQDKSSYDLLQSYGYKNVALAGDTRLDRVVDLVNNAKEMPLIKTFKQDQLLFIAGSTWPKDDELLIKFYKEHEKPFKMIIAPHEVHSSNIARLMDNLKEFNVIKYSDANKDNISGADVLIIDSIGLLSALYRYGEFAYIGGGFGKGIHNLLEAATWGIPVVFGPNYHKFKEAHELINLGGGFSINDYESLKSTLNQLLNDSYFLKDAGNKAKSYVEENSGATEIIFKKTFTANS